VKISWCTFFHTIPPTEEAVAFSRQHRAQRNRSDPLGSRFSIRVRQALFVSQGFADKRGNAYFAAPFAMMPAEKNCLPDFVTGKSRARRDSNPDFWKRSNLLMQLGELAGRDAGCLPKVPDPNWQIIRRQRPNIQSISPRTD
jgi:hypothetical protein